MNISLNDEEFLNSKVYKEFLNNNAGTGYLNIRAYSANQAIPVSGLKIFVNKKINGYNVNFYEGFTNESGVIENIGLPAPKLDSNDLVAPRSASYELIAIYNQTTLNFIVNVYDNLYVIQNISILPNMQGGN